MRNISRIALKVVKTHVELLNFNSMRNSIRYLTSLYSWEAQGFFCGHTLVRQSLANTLYLPFNKLIN